MRARGARPRVVHVITDLSRGGAEAMLVRLLAASDRDAVEHAVVSLKPGGALAAEIRDLGVPVQSVGLAAARSLPAALARLVATLRAWSPEVVHGWMYHANLLGGLAARLVGGGAVLWGLRHGAITTGTVAASTRAVVRTGAALSGWVPDRILCCSRAAASAHQALGYAAARMVVMPNGFDTARFRPSAAARRHCRAALGLDDATPVIALVARFDPVKDHRTFVAAAARLGALRPDARFVLCGAGVEAGNRVLAGWLAAAGLADRVLLLGPRADVHELLAAVDLATLCSRAEGFPNVVGEAMACGVPCVVTDVGDVRELVAEAGRVVAVADPEALAHAWHAVLGLDRERRCALGAAGRRHIEERFSITAVARRHQELYVELLRAA